MVVGRDWGCLAQSFPGLISQSLPSSVNSSPEASPVSYACRGSGSHSDLSCLMEGLRGQDWMGSKKDWGEVWGWPVVSAVAPLYQQSCAVYPHHRQPSVLPLFQTHLLQRPPEAQHLERRRKSYSRVTATSPGPSRPVPFFSESESSRLRFWAPSHGLCR